MQIEWYRGVYHIVSIQSETMFSFLGLIESGRERKRLIIMKQRLTRRDILLVGITLFSMFFGSGNLIFPPYLGFQAGTETWKGLAGMSVTAVLFPVLGIVAIAHSGDLMKLASRVGKRFAIIFTILVFLALGPGLAIPRNAAVSFEMAVAPFMKEIPLYVRIAYSAVFFAIAFWMSIHPERLTDTLGKVLGPVLLALILILVCGCFMNFSGNYGAPSGGYETSPIIRGFLEGYNTMDTLAALNFGNIIVLNLMNRNVTEKKDLVKASSYAGLIAGILLFVIYAAMANVGAMSGSLYSEASNGAAVLTNIVGSLFGNAGILVLGIVYVLACLTTCIGLLCSCAEFFAGISKISYRAWVILFTAGSFAMSIGSLDRILAFSVPILVALYPIAIVLVILGLLNEKISSVPKIYPWTIGFTAAVSILLGLQSAGISIPLLSDAIASIPPSADLCWIIPALIGAGIGILRSKEMMAERMQERAG